MPRSGFQASLLKTPKHRVSRPKSDNNEVLEFRLSKVGFPIRKSVDQSFFAAPHGLSQRSTSFIASQRQGIHRTPLRHLIALIINVHTLGRMLTAHLPRPCGQTIGCSRTMIRKTSLLRKIEPIARRSSFANRSLATCSRTRRLDSKRRNDLEIVEDPHDSLWDPTRIDLLFTMSENPHDAPFSEQRVQSDVSRTNVGSCQKLQSASAQVGFGATAFAHHRPCAAAPVGLARLAWPGRSAAGAKAGGACRDRTDDLMLAKHALSQLS